MLYQFRAYLSTQEKLSPDQIKGTISNLKSKWISELKEHAFFGDSQKFSRRRSNKLHSETKGELRQRLKGKRDREIYPLTLEMVGALRKESWVPNLLMSHLASALDPMGAYIAVVLGMNSSARPGNVSTKSAGNTETTVDVADLVFQVERPDQGGGHEELRGVQIRAVLMKKGKDATFGNLLQARLKWVKYVKMDYHKTKTGKPIKDMYIARRTVMEAELVEDICIWICVSKVEEEELLLTRHGITKQNRLSKKVISSQMVTAAAKLSARLCGMPDGHFSARSCRSGGNSTLHGAGVSVEEREKCGGWTSGSRGSHGNNRISNEHYNFDLESNNGGRGRMRGALAVDGKSTFNLQQVRELHDLSDIDPVLRGTRKGKRERKETTKMKEMEDISKRYRLGNRRK